MPLHVETSRVKDFAALGAAWRTLEAVAAPHAFFQSWTWQGCLADQRYTNPVLLRAVADGRVVGLALFNLRGGRLSLSESGDARLDAPFIEHNAPLLAKNAPTGTLAALLAAAWRVPGMRRLVLGGAPPDLAPLAGGTVLRRQDRVAPYIDLAALRAAGGDYAATLSANTRYQLRRSMRHFAAQGPVLLERATTLEQARDWLDALVALHGATWRARGKPGAFADAFAASFHQALVVRALDAGQLALLRASAGGFVLGYLYNFRHQGRVFAYQSGLASDGAGPHGKPGLTCHALAIEAALAEGDTVYDFLGGADRYKTSLANAAATLVWTEHVRRWSVLGMAARLRR